MAERARSRTRGESRAGSGVAAFFARKANVTTPPQAASESRAHGSTSFSATNKQMSAPDLGGPPLTAGIDIRTGSARPQKGRRDEIDDLISSYDANNDGRFSRDEVRRIIYDVRDLRKSNKLLKMAAVGLLLLCVMSLCSIFVVVLVGNEISKEESVNDEGELTSRATGSTVAVGRAESLSTLWDAPLLAPEAKAYLSELTAFVDMRGVSDVADWVEMTFKLGSAFQPLGSEGELQVYTVRCSRAAGATARPKWKPGGRASNARDEACQRS